MALLSHTRHVQAFCAEGQHSLVALCVAFTSCLRHWACTAWKLTFSKQIDEMTATFQALGPMNGAGDTLSGWWTNRKGKGATMDSCNLLGKERQWKAAQTRSDISYCTIHITAYYKLQGRPKWIHAGLTQCHGSEILWEIHAVWVSSLKAHSIGHSADTAQSSRFILINICVGRSAAPRPKETHSGFLSL